MIRLHLDFIISFVNQKYKLNTKHLKKRKVPSSQTTPFRICIPLKCIFRYFSKSAQDFFYIYVRIYLILPK